MFKLHLMFIQNENKKQDEDPHLCDHIMKEHGGKLEGSDCAHSHDSSHGEQKEEKDHSQQEGDNHECGEDSGRNILGQNTDIAKLLRKLTGKETFNNMSN